MFTTLVVITMISDRHIGPVDIGQQGWWRRVHQVPSPPPPLSMGLLSVVSVQTDMYLSRRAYSFCLMEFIEVCQCLVCCIEVSQCLVCCIVVQSVSGVLCWCTFHTIHWEGQATLHSGIIYLLAWKQFWNIPQKHLFYPGLCMFQMNEWIRICSRFEARS